MDGIGTIEPREPGREPRYGASDVLYGTLFAPQATFRRLAGNPPVGLALGAFIAISIFNAATAPIFMPPGHPLPGWIVRGMAFFGVFLSLGGLFLGAALFHLAAELLGGKGRGVSLLALLALANLPMVFDPPLSILSGLAGLPGVSAAVSLGLFLWVMVLSVLAVRESHLLSTARAAAVVLAPAGAVLLLVTIAVMAVGIAALNMPFLRGGLPF